MSQNTMVSKHQQRGQSRGMQFVSRISTMKPYYYLRVPVERNDSAKKFLHKQLLVSFTEVEEGEIT
jgi:hypothetical protein